MNKTPFYSKNSFAEYYTMIKNVLLLEQLNEKQAKMAMKCYLEKMSVEQCAKLI